MNVVICRSNPVDPDPRVEKTAAALAGAGHRVQILAWDRSTHLPAEEAKEWGIIRRFRLAASFGSGLRNWFPLLRWQAWLGWQLFRLRGKYHAIHACDFDTILPALTVGRLFGKPVVYDIFDFYVEHLRSTPDIVKRIIRRVDLGAVHRANAVILVDEARQQQIESGRPRRVEVIYNTPPDCLEELSHAAPLPAEPAFRIAYVGILQVERGLLELFEVLRRHPDWQLDLAGFGGDEVRLVDAARNLQNIHWHGRMPYKDALSLMHASDVLVALYDPAVLNHRLASPNKLFEAMMLARALVVARGTHIDDLVEQNQCGVVVPYGEVDALEAALLRLEADPGLRRQLGQNGRRVYERQYSWATMEQRIANLYSSLAGGSRR
jgi:glycosyltransferase involved in cell wall biosynthesis